VPGFRAIAEYSRANRRGRAWGEERAREALPEFTLTPEEKRFTLSDEWVLLGDLRSDGAGGPDRTVRSFEFLLPVPA
jgi:hypothetical protein